MPGKIEHKSRRGQQRIRWLGSITDLMDMNLNKLQELWRTEETGIVLSMVLQRVVHDLMMELQQQLYIHMYYYHTHKINLKWINN